MIIDQRSDQFWAPTNPGGNVAGAFPTRLPTTRHPFDPGTTATGVALPRDGVIEMGGLDGEKCAANLVLIALGTGVSGGTFSLCVYGWTPTPGKLMGVSSLPLWVPNLLNITSCGLGGANGVEGSDVPSNRLFASGMAVTYGFGTATNTGGQNVAVLTVPTMGYRYLEVNFAVGTNVTGMNALYRKV